MKPRPISVIVAIATLNLAVACGQHTKKHPVPPPAAPAALPDAKQLIERALATEKATYSQRENYLCELHAQRDELDSHGNLKKKHSEDEEEFFVNGHQIDHTLAKDGQALSSSDARKEQERVDKEVKKYSDPSQKVKEESEEQKRIESVLRMMQFNNERRETVNGRPTIDFDITGNLAAQPQDLNDRFVQAMQGTLQLDEATGQLVDLNIRSVKDVKIAGGLIASLHKGFWLHLHQVQHPDGVWLPDLAEGSGDARAALFLHPYFRFHQTEGDCHLYGVSTTQTVAEPKSQPPK
jgi:hypothetical protein